ncbi:hypothetical protein R3P38DRAFT_3177889 [Favolaschia claudopus]|uniref:Uncharacterized protein n=1 Tax=Favolaschia claudopus TaxID=2862362 RepID=A0AAW0CWJ9_9AGAR
MARNNAALKLDCGIRRLAARFFAVNQLACTFSHNAPLGWNRTTSMDSGAVPRKAAPLVSRDGSRMKRMYAHKLRVHLRMILRDNAALPVASAVVNTLPRRLGPLHRHMSSPVEPHIEHDRTSLDDASLDNDPRGYARTLLKGAQSRSPLSLGAEYQLLSFDDLTMVIKSTVSLCRAADIFRQTSEDAERAEDCPRSVHASLLGLAVDQPAYAAIGGYSSRVVIPARATFILLRLACRIDSPLPIAPKMYSSTTPTTAIADVTTPTASSSEVYFPIRRSTPKASRSKSTPPSSAIVTSRCFVNGASAPPHHHGLHGGALSTDSFREVVSRP